MEAKDIKKVQDFCDRKNREVLEARKSQHTPGPWTVGPLSADGSFPILGNVTRSICEVKNPFSRDDKGQTKANAALISACPDLLAACQSLLTDCDLNPIGHGGRMDTAILFARAAIAKAKGVTK